MWVGDCRARAEVSCYAAFWRGLGNWEVLWGAVAFFGWWWMGQGVGQVAKMHSRKLCRLLRSNLRVCEQSIREQSPQSNTKTQPHPTEPCSYPSPSQTQNLQTQSFPHNPFSVPHRR